MKEQIKTPQKVKQNRDKQFIRYRVQNIGYKDAQGTNEDLNSIKKIQSDTKDTPIEVKNNLQGNNSRVNEAKNQSNGLEHKEAKNKQSEQKEKKESKIMRIV